MMTRSWPNYLAYVGWSIYLLTSDIILLARNREKKVLAASIARKTALLIFIPLTIPHPTPAVLASNTVTVPSINSHTDIRTTTHMINNSHSVHALVRLLKSPTDPPSASGPSKIEIACLAWSDPTFRAINKGEVIGEWVLTLFGQAKKTVRQKGPNSTSGPISDPRFWSLLCGVLTALPPASARPLKTWLLPLLNRLQLDAVVVELLASRSSQVLPPARSALAVLWPLTEKKISVDALEECLGAVFDACIQWEHVDVDLAWISSAVVGTYRNALANSGNKKKFYNTFLSTRFSSWMCVVSSALPITGSLFTRQLQDVIYVAGTDTLFSLDALKQPLDTLFDALSSSLSSFPQFFSLLPRLFTSFLSATHKHRSTLFVTATSATSGKEELRKMGMEFLQSCWTLAQNFVSLQKGFNIGLWRSIVGVLGLVEKERLFVPHSVRGTHISVVNGGCGGELVLREASDKAIEMLENLNALSKDDQVEQAFVSVRLLDVLVQIEFNFIGSVLQRVLSALINIPPMLSGLVITPASEFLTRVLEYHVKTRTVHTYTLALLDAVVVSSASCTLWTPTSSYMISNFPLAYHLPALARALRASLTPTQIMPLAIAVLRAVESAWTAVKDADQGSGVIKNRKITEDSDKTGLEARTVSIQARAFSFTSRIAGTVLSNLPPSPYTEGREDSLKKSLGDAGKLGWSIVWECLREREGKDGKDHGNYGKKRNHVAGADPPSTNYSHMTSSAVLRFLYDIRARVSSPLGECDWLGESDIETLLDVVRDGASEPELVLDIIRTLYWQMWYTHCESKKQIMAQPIFAVTLDALSTHISLGSEWSGMVANLTRDNLGLAILYVLTDRWIEAFDTLGSTECLEKLISLLFSVPLELHDENAPEKLDGSHLQKDNAVVTPRFILFKLFQNAHFWELRNIRAVFLSTVMSLTASLSSLSFPPTGIELSASTTVAQTELALACNTYRLLGCVPPEYFTRSVRGELIRRAMIGDAQVCAVLTGASEQRMKAKGTGINEVDTEHSTKESEGGIMAEELKSWSRRLTYVRAFLKHMGRFLNTSNHTTSFAFVNHLLNLSSILSPSKALTNVTLDLIELHVLNLLRSQGSEAATSVSSIISIFAATGPFSQPASQETWKHTVIQSCILKLIEHLTNDFDSTSFPDEVKHSLGTLLDALQSALSPYIKRSLQREATELFQFFPNERISAWSHILSLTRWLGNHSQLVLIPLGLKLAKSITDSGISASLYSQTCSSILMLLFEELWCMSNVPHRAHLDMVVGFYAVHKIEYIDTYVTQASKKLSTEDFSGLLDIVAEEIEGSGLKMDHRERVVHLAKAILHDAPQGTLKVTQNFVTRCLSSFADRDKICGSSSSLKMQYLEFTARHCSDRPLALRLMDLGNIWTYLNTILSGSSEHDATTTFPIFHHITIIINALIRLRRDLVVHTLPHLSLVLRQLIMLTRKIRPQLGARQSKIVTDTFPSWLSASQPISTDEARALARLLTSLTTKTVPRSRTYGRPSASTESRKAESLAKPFAKHASYVLVAYVNAFNDPLCIISAEMRRELEPGLFALCEMVGEHSRDALMVSALDSGGKTIMKSLWKEYEKQRYVGKG